MKKTKPEYYLQLYTVEGSGEFPFDMLRYDSACFATESETALATQYDVRRAIRLRRFTREPGRATSSQERWASFGWKVVAS